MAALPSMSITELKLELLDLDDPTYASNQRDELECALKTARCALKTSRRLLSEMDAGAGVSAASQASTTTTVAASAASSATEVGQEEGRRESTLVSLAASSATAEDQEEGRRGQRQRWGNERPFPERRSIHTSHPFLETQRQQRWGNERPLPNRRSVSTSHPSLETPPPIPVPIPRAHLVGKESLYEAVAEVAVDYIIDNPHPSAPPLQDMRLTATTEEHQRETYNDGQKKYFSQTKSRDEVEQWLLFHLPSLQQKDVEKYCDSLAGDGFDSLAMLEGLEYGDLNFMKKAHRRALMKELSMQRISIG